MKLSNLRRAYRLFSNDNASKTTIRHNVLAYCNAMNYLGDKHILANPVTRKGN